MTRKILFAAVAALFAVPAAAQEVTFMTGPQGGVWVPLGGSLKGMWEKAIPGLQVTATPGAGIANIRGIDEGKAQHRLRQLEHHGGRPRRPRRPTRRR